MITENEVARMLNLHPDPQDWPMPLLTHLAETAALVPPIVFQKFIASVGEHWPEVIEKQRHLRRVEQGVGP